MHIPAAASSATDTRTCEIASTDTSILVQLLQSIPLAWLLFSVFTSHTRVTLVARAALVTESSTLQVNQQEGGERSKVTAYMQQKELEETFSR